MGDDGKSLKLSASGINKATCKACESFDAAMKEVNSQFDTHGSILVKENCTNVVVEPVI